jgi:arabinan endo-1,5-alpha-L-arabinosidase
MKRSLFSFVVIIMLSSAALCCQSPGRKTAAAGAVKTYTNPVLNQNYPDPTVIQAPDGYYYAYATNHEVQGQLVHIQVSRSRDLVAWEQLGDAMPQKPAWATHDFWAPHVSYDRKNKTYYLYYSGETPGDALGKCLGVATSKDPAGPFLDKGEPLLCGESFVNIDPMAFDDPQSGKKLLYWGSAHQPIRVRELTDDRLQFKPGTAATEVVPARPDRKPDNYENLIEGAWVVFRQGYYYLYYSGDNCCGDKAHYAVMVARARQATGPFETLEQAKGIKNSVILARNDRWLAPGHNSIVSDAAGQDWIVYHAIDTAGDKKGRVMLLDRLHYLDGWPKVLADGPSTGKQFAPKVK